MARAFHPLRLAVLAFVVLVLAQAVYFYTATAALKGQGSGTYGTGVAYDVTTNMITGDITANTDICINQPPAIAYTCNQTIPWGYAYQCDINFTDSDGDSVTKGLTFSQGSQIFSINSTGGIEVTPTEGMIGSYVIAITGTDDSGCGNTQTTASYNLSVIDANHSPYLRLNIPNATLTYLNAFTFSLNNYFSDLDGDISSYFFVDTSGSTTVVSVTIDNSSLTVIRGLNCGTAYGYFVAVDDAGLTNVSNRVRYTVTNCPTDAGGETGTEDESSGGDEGEDDDCVPEWVCGGWGQCRITNHSVRECYDRNACSSRDYRKMFTQQCVYNQASNACVEEWVCDEWSTCSDEGSHTRTCFDRSNCGTFFSRPFETEACTQIPTCFNGIMDGDETSIDCGGKCGKCRIQEQTKNTGGPTAATIIIIMSSIAAVGALGTYAVKHSTAILKLIQKPITIHKKVYLDSKAKILLNQQLDHIQSAYDKRHVKEVINELYHFGNKYYQTLFSLESISKQELSLKFGTIEQSHLQALLKGYYVKVIDFKMRSNLVSPMQLQAFIDESRHHLYAVTEFTSEDAAQAVKIRITKAAHPYEQFYVRIANIYNASNFLEAEIAMRYYREAHDIYKKLSAKQQSLIYADLVRAYHAIKLAQYYRE